MSDRRLAILADLERAEEEIAADVAEIDELYAAVEELRGRALELADQIASLPERLAAAAEAVREAELGVAASRTAAERAVADLAQAGEEELADARRREVTARDSLHIAERLAATARGSAAELEAFAEAAESETRALEARAGGLAEAVVCRPRLAAEAVSVLGTGAGGVAEWGTGARAALLVARGQLAAEQDAVVRQAHETAAVVLGEALPPLGTHEVVRRVQAEIGG